jgi:hypothetical protein
LQKIGKEAEGSFRCCRVRARIAEARMKKLAFPKFEEHVVATAAIEKPLQKIKPLPTG